MIIIDRVKILVLQGSTLENVLDLLRIQQSRDG